MSSVDQIQVALRVFGESLEPDEVSALLGTQPSEAHRKGDPMARSGDVSAVPVPAAVWLFGSGLMGLLGLARRKR